MSVRRIAELTGFSTTTVSAALLAKPGVARSTRERILDVARELSYTPHGPARALVSGKIGTIGVVPTLGGVSSYVSPFDSLIIAGVWDACEESSVSVVLMGKEEKDQVPRMIAQRLVDGAVFFTRFPHPRISEYMRNRGIPMVTADVGPEGETDSVYPDDAQGVRLAIEHLVSLGHRRIGYITSESESMSHRFSVTRRLNSYLAVMAELGFRAPKGSEVRGPAEARMERLLREDRMTAVVCYDDHVALNALRALSARRMRVPEDISVVGIDNLEVCLFATPRLTTVHVPFKEMGREAARLLLERLETPEMAHREVMLPEELVVRESTAPPRGE